jgi:hypothetical protein
LAWDKAVPVANDGCHRRRHQAYLSLLFVRQDSPRVWRTQLGDLGKYCVCIAGRKLNNPSFNPFTPVSVWHVDFIVEIDCGFHTVEHNAPADARKVQDYLTTFCSDFIKIISKWERSGNNDGGIDMHDENKIPVGFGALANLTSRALDVCGSFLGGRASYILHFWKLSDKHHIFDTTLYILNQTACAVDAAHAPAIFGVASSANKTLRSKEEKSYGIQKLTKSITSFSAADSNRDERNALQSRN